MRSEHRILTTHVGSLVRPPELLAILETLYAGKPVSGAELDAALERAVTDVVKHQADCGVDIVSDGEYGKSHSWSQYIIERLQGFERRPQPSGAGLAAHREKNHKDAGGPARAHTNDPGDAPCEPSCSPSHCWPWAGALTRSAAIRCSSPWWASSRCRARGSSCAW
jgi:hypothetical protein